MVGGPHNAHGKAVRLRDVGRCAILQRLGNITIQEWEHRVNLKVFA